MRRRLPRRLLRNLGFFYLVLAGLAVLLVLNNMQPGFHKSAWQRAQHALYWVRDKSVQVFPIWIDALPLTSELARSILAEGLPRLVEMEKASGPQLSPNTLRSIVQVVTDYDLAEPQSLVAAAFPGSRSTSGPLRWDWIIQRGIEGYSLGSLGGPASWRESSEDSSSDPAGAVEVMISAPGYAALVTGEAGPSVTLEGSTTVSVYDSESRSVQPAADFSSLASRLESLARVSWGSSPLVAIYHTHTGETYRDAAVNSAKSYAWDVAQPGAGLVPGVVQVGERLTRELQRRYGIPVVHSSKVHDYPVFAYAYSNSEKTAQMLVERYPSLQLVLDIHRDEGTTLETVQGRQLAGVLIIVATGAGTSLSHGNWRQNLETAQLLKENFDRLYPGLCRGLMVKERARYNQHLHTGSLLLEIGAHSDHLDSALMTADFVADVLAETLWQLQSGSRARDGSRKTPAAPSAAVEIFEPKIQRTISGF